MEKELNYQSIPHTVHFIWFGNNPKSELIDKCIASWKKFLPNWNFVEWNELNYDVNKCSYIKEAYENQKYAFAADYARFDILYNYGGVYFDTDVELLKAIPESYMELEGFTAVESNNNIAPGLVLAVKPHNKIIGEILKQYNQEHFMIDNKMNLRTVVRYTTEVFENHGFKVDGSMQDIEGIRIFPLEYFCAYDFDIREFQITDNTISIHHYTYAWGSPIRKKLIECKMLIKHIVGISNYKKLLRIKRRLFGTQGVE